MAGECTDGAVNDRDGAFDCADSECGTAPDCADTDTDTEVEPDASYAGTAEMRFEGTWRGSDPVVCTGGFEATTSNAAITTQTRPNAMVVSGRALRPVTSKEAS